MPALLVSQLRQVVEGNDSLDAVAPFHLVQGGQGALEQAAPLGLAALLEVEGGEAVELGDQVDPLGDAVPLVDCQELLIGGGTFREAPGRGLDGPQQIHGQ
jgi:hypothetical protein